MRFALSWPPGVTQARTKRENLLRELKRLTQWRGSRCSMPGPAGEPTDSSLREAAFWVSQPKPRVYPTQLQGLMRRLKRSAGRTLTTEKTSGRRPYKELRTRVSGSLIKEPGHAGKNVLACCPNYTASELRVNRTLGPTAWQ